MTEQTYTDPPGMPEDERMTPAELRMVRDYLGLTADWLAARLGVSARTVRHWEAGRYPIPDGVRQEVEHLEELTAQAVHDTAARLMDIPEPWVVTYRSDAEYAAVHPEAGWPASWHRHLLARIAERVTGLRVVYAPVDAPDTPAPVREVTGRA